MLGVMASSVIMKVVATSPAPSQLSSKESGLACTHHSNGHSPSSPPAPELTSPLPLEATPLPPSLPSPVSLPPSLENGLDIDIFKKEVEENVFIKMLQQKVGINDSIDVSNYQRNAKDVRGCGEHGETKDLEPGKGLKEAKAMESQKMKETSVATNKQLGTMDSTQPKVQKLANITEKHKDNERPKVLESSKPLTVQAIPFPIPMSLAPAISAAHNTAAVVTVPASRSAIPSLEALVNFIQRQDGMKVVPFKVLAMNTGKEAVIPVQEKPPTAVPPSHSVAQGSSVSAAAAMLATLPTVVTAVAVSAAPVTPVPTALVPTTSVPSTSVPAATVPSTSVPAASVPSTSVPAASVPASSVPTTTSVTAAPAPIPPSVASTPVKKEKEMSMEVGGKDMSEVSPPSLHANEEMLEDDSDDEEEMDIGAGLLIPPANVDSAVAQAPPMAPPSVRSDSVSPYADDDFAMFVAQEANEVLPVLDQDSLSSSPTPTPTPSSNDMLTGDNEGHAKSHMQHFGATAFCPPIPLQLSEDAPIAPLDMTAHNFPKRSKYAHRAAMSAMHPYNRTRGGGAAVAKTLDLIKSVLQPSLNMEVKRLCDSYRNIFDMAASNINENTGDTVPSSTLQMLIVKMLEEAKLGYAHGKWEFPNKKLPQNEKITAAKGSPMSTKKLNKTEKEVRVAQTKRQQRKGPSDRQNENRPIGWRWGMDKRRLDPLNWDPDKLTTETDFVLGVNVNKALGHAANRGKVYYLHPELFKYACDGDDKTWLYENKHLPVHGGKAFLMIFSEVEALVRTEDCYKTNQEVCNCVTKLEQFSVPTFMIEKMKNFIRSVQGYFTQEANNAAAAAAATATAATATVVAPTPANTVPATAIANCSVMTSVPPSLLPSATCPAVSTYTAPTIATVPPSFNNAL